MAIGGTKRVFGHTLESKQDPTEGDTIGPTSLGQTFLKTFPPGCFTVAE